MSSATIMTHSRFLIRLILCGGLLCAAGCTLTRPADSAGVPTPIIVTLAPINTTPQIGITVPAVQSLSAPPTPCATTPNAAATRYAADATIDMTTHSVSATLYTTYRNETGTALSSIIFNVVAAHRPDTFTLTALGAGANSDSYTFADGRLDVNLRQPLLPGCDTTIGLGFTIKVPLITGVTAKNGYFGYTERQLNLGDWLPAVAPYRAGDWVVPRYWPEVGETTVTEAADYAVGVTVQGTNPGRVMVAGAGTATRNSATTWHFMLDHARNFALSVSEAFTLQSATAANGVVIDLYTFSHAPTIDAPGHVLATAQTALVRYETLFGPCPYKHLTIVQADFPDGMEFSGLVFIGGGWFTSYEGKPDSWLTLITAHELSHQWWYSSVGDDQARTPFMDEAFATYSELLFLEGAYPTLTKWWWTFRVKLFQPEGYVDSSVYDFTTQRPYINAVYLRGVLMLDEIRSTIGSDAFLRWLHDYASTQADHIASPTDLWGLLSATDYARTAAIRARYMRNPDPLGTVATAVPTVTPTDITPTPVKRSRPTSTA